MSITYESLDFSREVDHVDLFYNDGTCDVIDDITCAMISTKMPLEKMTFAEKVISENKNKRKDNYDTDVSFTFEGTWHPFRNKKNPYAEIAFLEKAAESQQNIGWMAAMTAVMVRIQRGFTLEELKEYIKKEQNEYNEWYRKRLNNELEMGSCRN